MAYVDGTLVERKYTDGIKLVRKALKKLVRKYAKLVFYQILKLSHSKRGCGHFTYETGWVDREMKFNRTSNAAYYTRKTRPLITEPGKKK